MSKAKPGYVSPELVRRIARAHKLDEDIFDAQIRQESGYKKTISSPAGAQDVAQFMPDTAKAYGVKLGDGRAKDDLHGAARHMKDLLKQFDGDYRKALAAYNAGAGAVQKYGGIPPYKETQNYVKTIMGASRKSTGTQSGGQPSRHKGEQPVTIPGVDGQSIEFNSRDTGARVGAAMKMLKSKGGVLEFAQEIKGIEAQEAASSETLQLPGLPAIEMPAAPKKTGAKGGGGKNPGSLGEGLGAVKVLDRMAAEIGAPITAKQEPGHTAGGDHDPAVKGATARDFGGNEAVRKALWRRTLKAIGLDPAEHTYKGADINHVHKGVRYQIISRDHGSGPHLHVGMRKV